MCFLFSVLGTNVANASELNTLIMPSFNVASDYSANGSLHLSYLFGEKIIKIGPYAALRGAYSYLTEKAFGVAIRVDSNVYYEIQGGYFERNFGMEKTLTGKGYLFNVVIGKKLSERFAASIMTSFQRIESGLDKRWLVKILPYWGISFVF